MGIAAKEAGEKAAVAGRVAAEAAEKAAKGMLKEGEAARLAARAVRELERAEIAQAAAALAAATASEKAARAHNQQSASATKATKSASLMRGELVTLVAVGAAIAPAFVVAGTAVAGFGALAVPTIKKVIESQTKMAETWDSMSEAQKVSSVSTRMLTEQYKGLAKAVEPDVLKVYNNALAVTSRIMPRLVPLTRATSGALVDFENKIESALNSDRATQFFRFVEAQAAPAMDQLGDTLGSTAHLAVSLTESLAPLAGVGLGVVGMTAQLLANLSDLSPELAQLAVLGVGLRGPLSSMGEMAGKAGEKYRTYSAGAKGASAATKLLNLATAAGPNLYMAAGLAIAYFGLKALNAKSSTDKLVESITVANRAVGNNVAGYVAANRALDQQMVPATQRAADAQQRLISNSSIMNVQMAQGATAAQALTEEWVKQAKSDNDKKFANVQAGAAALGRQYGITASQAITLADAVGVDMSKGITENGTVIASTAAKFDRYRQAVEMARNPTAVVAQAWRDAGNEALMLKDQVNAAASAMDAFFNPALNVLSATNQMRDALASSNRVLNDSKATALDRSKALEAQLGPMGRWVNAQVAAKRSVSLTDSAIRQQLPSLVRLASGNRAGQAALSGFVASMGGVISRTRSGTTIVDRFGNRVKVLPNGKVTVIKAQAGQANSALDGVRGRINSLRDRVVRVTVAYSTTGRAIINGTPSVGAFDRGATGGLVTGSGIRRAEGGPIDEPGRRLRTPSRRCCPRTSTSSTPSRPADTCRSLRRSTRAGTPTAGWSGTPRAARSPGSAGSTYPPHSGAASACSSARTS